MGEKECLYSRAVVGGRGENVTFFGGNAPLLTLLEVTGAVQGEGRIVF